MDLPKRGALPKKRSSLSKNLVSSGIKGKRTADGRRQNLTSLPLADTEEEAPQQLTKAEKRALKRSELMQSVGAPASQTAARLAKLPPHMLSKSALRRQKRKEREQLAGNSNGMKDVASIVDEVQIEHDQAKRAAEAASKVGAAPLLPPGGNHDPSQAGSSSSRPALSSRKRKQVLAEERSRQEHILSDPAFAKSPFAALRQHARNALAFSDGAAVD
ncbi:hypothetical protein OC846_000490 [Tilletia horrida]|uniref:Ribosome biogenesis protein SLX9 n=1 Tax=Tilletia horrida TaxID=155126 RepID=A0AAN6GUW6_9BASI|nr:hypothetical protein OC845_001108 [Tilletia horrida]KAK0557502.1 hypothetical protein OC846_000490 [Tilletia horrida]KAK0567881.1 hypothetical protein OC861_002441 [Tilletia horrida]